MAFDVKDKVALVTGANRGIGRVITETLLERGAAKVYAAVRDPSTITKLADSHPNKAVAIPLDLSKPETIVAAAETTGDVELVVNNAGVAKMTSALAPNALENLAKEIDVNLFGLVRMARAYAPILKKNGGGAFVQLNSVASLRAFAPLATYSASKAAAYSITQALREELAKQGTQVLSVHPGPIQTDMGEAAGFGDIAEPAIVVAEGIVRGLAAGDMHVFPDTFARQMGEAFDGFRLSVIEKSDA